MKKSHRALACRGLIAATLAFGSLPYAHAGWCDRVQGTGAKLAAAAATVTATVGGALKLTGVGAVVHSSAAMIVSTAGTAMVSTLFCPSGIKFGYCSRENSPTV